MALGVGLSAMGNTTSRTDVAAEEFAALYRVHFGPLSGYAQALVGDHSVAIDIAQEAFTRLLAKWITVREPRPWLFFVATNLARDHWRRVSRDRDLTIAAAQVSTGHHSDQDPWLRDLVERLPERLRTPVLLHYYADLPVEEVARLTRRPLGTIKRRLHEARAELLKSAGDHT